VIAVLRTERVKGENVAHSVCERRQCVFNVRIYQWLCIFDGGELYRSYGSLQYKCYAFFLVKDEKLVGTPTTQLYVLYSGNENTAVNKIHIEKNRF
jgi:hypothetical protein